MKGREIHWAGVMLALLGLALGLAGRLSAEEEKNKYESAARCRNCHEEPSKGNQYMRWKESKHAKAFDTLATDESKQLAGKMGIGDPQKSDKCLKCHVTAFGAAKEELGQFFKPENVQCEACHGPGAKHIKARLEAEARQGEDDIFEDDEGEHLRAKPPPGEIISKVEEKTCLSCHNQESPTYKEFKLDEANKEIEHPDPRPRPV